MCRFIAVKTEMLLCGRIGNYSRSGLWDAILARHVTAIPTRFRMGSFRGCPASGTRVTLQPGRVQTLKVSP